MTKHSDKSAPNSDHELTNRNFYRAGEESRFAEEAPVRTPQTEHPAYQLAFRDHDFLLRDELRPVRFQLELLKPEMLQSMAAKPVVFACSNPDPEISPELAMATRDDLIIATGRSDYPNQVNNVLGFPFIFRGALDVHATGINEAMKVAAVRALSDLAREPVPQDVLDAFELESLSFGPEYIIPKPMDCRLLPRLATAVAQAAIDSGVARADLPQDYAAYLAEMAG